MDTDEAATDDVAELAGWGDVQADAVHLLSGGRVHLRCLGTDYLLAPPNNRQVHDTQLAVQDLLSDHGQTLGKFTSMQARITEDAGEGATADRIQEVAKAISDEITEETYVIGDRTLQVVAGIIHQLGVGSPTVDHLALPPWCAQVDLLTDIIAHWRRVPRVPGS